MSGCVCNALGVYLDGDDHSERLHVFPCDVHRRQVPATSRESPIGPKLNLFVDTFTQCNIHIMDTGLFALLDPLEMIGRAVASADLESLYRDSGLNDRQILDQIYPKLPDMLAPVVDTVSLLAKLDADIATIRDIFQKERSLKWQLVLWAAVTVVAGVAWHLVPHWSIALVRVATFACAAGLTVGISRAAHTIRRVVGLERRLGNLDYIALTKEQVALRIGLRQSVYDFGVYPEVTGILSRATAESYETQLGTFTSHGLSEVFAVTHGIDTKAKRELDSLLKLSGGSVGLAGPRGVGKTTLMTLLANRPISKEQRPCSISCSAPVEYSGRDFIVTLFVLLCSWVIEERGRSLDGSVNGFENRWSPVSKGSTRDILNALIRRVSKLCFIVGLGMLASGVWLTWETARTAAVNAAVTRNGTEFHGGGSETLDRQSAVFSYVKIMGIEPGTLVKVAGTLLILTLIAYWMRSLVAHVASGSPGWRTSVGLPSTRDLRTDSLGEAALAYEESLRFQQSYSSGWSGVLKVPIGIEGGINDARTLSRNQRSLPELVRDFRDFVRRVTAVYGRVIVCIDELDKLEADDKAHQFLNELKAVFGVPNVFYFVSVSEDAISAFERRGLPFRDAFDSAFDTIVHVTYLTLHESKSLLKRRTTRVPEPFLSFCHCMSGGLPRDLIRVCREMLHLAQVEKTTDLSSLARGVVMTEIRNKARGMIIPASKAPVDGAGTKFLAFLTDLTTRELATAGELMDRVRDLYEDAQMRRRATIRPRSEDCVGAPDSGDALNGLELDFALYLAYVATVWEVVERCKTPEEWRAADGKLFSNDKGRGERALGVSNVEALASVRQSLAISSMVGRQRLVEFRRTNGLDVSALK